MTTFIPFQPSNVGPPQFTATFDEQQYIVKVVWGLFGQRYYVQCNALDGSLVFNLPLIASLAGKAIQTLVFNELTGNAEGTTVDPHAYKLASTLALTVSGASPDAYNGKQLVLITGKSSFTYPLKLSADPGQAMIPGAMSYDISMSAGYFESTLVFRNGQFEVSP